MGNYRNLQSITRGQIIKKYFDIYNVDLRNHGESFHSNDGSIRANTNDILEIVDKKI